MQKTSLRALGVLAVICCLTTTSDASDIHAASCASADVQTAIDSASDGQTVVLPTCTATWFTTVRIEERAITLQGAGMDQTVITDMTGNAWNEPALWIQSLEGQSIRVTRIGFVYGLNGTVQDYNGAIVIRGASHQVRIDHNKFVDFWNRSMQSSGQTYGLIDHNLFQRTASAANSFQATNTNADGDGSWTRPLALGTANAFYIEDNVFDFYGEGSSTDSHSGGRFVFRHNMNLNGTMLNHGLDTSDRSSHSFEIYDNTFSLEEYTFNVITIRGGTGTIFRNSITNSETIDIPIIAQHYRSCTDYPGSHGVRCNGTNPIDGNVLSSGYPCKDQHGRTTGQQHHPIYVWDNVFNAQDIDMQMFDPWQCTDPSMADHLQEGRDFINDAHLPGYVPSPYPHPMTLGDYPGQQRSLDLQSTSGGGKVHLSWQAVTGAASYSVLRDWQLVWQTSSTGWTDLPPDGEYVYMVYAYDGSSDVLAAEGQIAEPYWNLIFGDGFEEGNQDRWSSVAPSNT